ncbi:MAG: sigma-70 family RNA polymerase sigma factor [Bacteroidales bacterium]|nr:sigma-70 family RNA polymerase sigma factor [Candidatus Scybalousia scybalohippi]
MENKEKRFEQIVTETKSMIYTVCYMFSKDQQEVEDLFQQSLINMWNGFDGFQDKSSVKTWVYRVSLNTCISWDRKKKVKTEPLDMNMNLFTDQDEDTKQINMLYKRINQLGPFDRAIVLLWLENMSYQEIGDIVGISAKNVSVRLVRIREELKKMSNNK